MTSNTPIHERPKNHPHPTPIEVTVNGEFVKSHREHQKQWKEEVAGVRERGIWKKRPARIRFPKADMAKNLLPAYASSILKHLKDCKIVHDDVVSAASSQAFALQLAAPFFDHPEKMLPILRAALPPELAAQIESVTHVEAEYDADNRYLGENPDARRGEKRTNSDLAIWWVDTEDRERLLLIEVKYLETEFGACSTGKNIRGACDKDGARLAASDWSDCPLQRQGRQYFKLMKKLDVFDVSVLADSVPCALRHGLYQLIRNQLQAAAIEADPDSEIKRADFAVLIHPGNHKVLELKAPVAGEDQALAAFRRALKNPGRFHEIDARAWLEAGLGQDAPSHWAEPMLSRYFPKDLGEI